MGNTSVSARAATQAVLRVRFPNADHELLRPDAEDPSAKKSTHVFEAKSGGRALDLADPADPVKRSGREAYVDFKVEPAMDDVDLRVVFQPRFFGRAPGPKGGSVPDPARPIQSPVWSMSVKVRRGGSSGKKVLHASRGEAEGSLNPMSFYLAEPLDGSPPFVDGTGAKTHQLVDWPSYSVESASAVTTIHLYAEVVDVTDIWKKVSSRDQIDIFEAHAAAEQKNKIFPSGAPWDALRILASTSTKAGNLFAVFIPSKARDSKRDKIGVGVMFTPGYLVYESLAVARSGHAASASSGPHTQYNLNRYLLAKKRSLAVAGTKPDLLRTHRFADFVGGFWRASKGVKKPHEAEGYWTLIPMGQASSVETSGKNVLWFVPLRSGKQMEGVFAQRDHRDTLHQALRLLWTQQRVAKGRAGSAPRAGRVALAGFSNGAESLFQAIVHNPHASEVYAFDPNPPPGGKGKFVARVVDEVGFLNNGDHVLCVTAGLVNYTGNELNGILAELAKTQKSVSSRVCVHPTSDEFWGAVRGSNDKVKGAFYWPDPHEPSGAQQAEADPSSAPNLGQEWLRLIRPTNVPDKAPMSVLTYQEVVDHVVTAPKYEKRPALVTYGLDVPLPYGLQRVLLDLTKVDTPERGGDSSLDLDMDLTRAIAWRKDIAHQFAVFGGALLPKAKGGTVFSDYLTCFLAHWSRFDDD